MQIAALLGLLTMTACSSSDEAAQVQVLQLERHGVTWFLEGSPQHGRFANGDWWVVGPVTLREVSPRFDGAHHGWELNPADNNAQGFDERIDGWDQGRVPSLPREVAPGTSIVKSVSLSPLDDSECRPCLQSAAVLTVLAEPPPNDGATVFRPAYFGDDKTLYSTEALATELLPTLAPVGEPPALDEMTAAFERVQLDHKENWTGRAMHPADNMPDYGSSIAGRNAEGALRLMLDDPLEAKLPLLLSYVQMGIDLHHMAQGGVSWPPNGGHSEGRKLPVTFAAVLLGDDTMKAAVSGAGRDAYGENGGMYVSPGGEVLFGQTQNSEDDYWTNLVFDTGSRTIVDPYQTIDGGHRPGDSYQFCCLSQPWKSTATALRLMPELEVVWSFQPFFDYVDRWVSFGAWTQPDSCAPPRGVCAQSDVDGTPCTSASEADVCTGPEEAHCDLTVSWDAGYGVDYGPDGSGGCIADTDPSDGTGRFPQLHGASTDDGYYGSGFASAMWDAYVAP